MIPFTDAELYKEYERIIKQNGKSSGSGSIQLLGWEIEYLESSTIASFVDYILYRGINGFLAEDDSPFILDCGANIGYTVLYYRKIFPNAKIIAFEPDPLFLPLLKRNLQRNNVNNVELVEAAVWVKDGYAQWYLEGIDGSRIVDRQKLFFGGRFAGVGQNAPNIDVERNIISVPTINILRYLSNKVDLLKLDIEGAEFEVVPHITPKLSNVKNILIECHITQSNISKLGELLNVLVDSGFKIGINSYGPWSDLLRHRQVKYPHSEQYLLISGWREEHANVDHKETYIPYVGLQFPLQMANQKTEWEKRELKVASLLFEMTRNNVDFLLKELPSPFVHEINRCWLANLGQGIPDVNKTINSGKSLVLLAEDDKLLGPMESSHEDIRSMGNGRYAYGNETLYFSTSDDSDPNINGKKYMLLYVNAKPSRVDK